MLSDDRWQVFTEQLLELHKGQGMDIHWRDSDTCPSEEEYKLMVKRSKFSFYHFYYIEWYMHGWDEKTVSSQQKLLYVSIE